MKNFQIRIDDKDYEALEGIAKETGIQGARWVQPIGIKMLKSFIGMGGKEPRPGPELVTTAPPPPDLTALLPVEREVIEWATRTLSNPAPPPHASEQDIKGYEYLKAFIAWSKVNYLSKSRKQK